jgi:hypothetical protein
MTLSKAYELAHFKWTEIVKRIETNKDTTVENIYYQICELPELKDLKAGCAYCELYFDEFLKCSGCPLVINNITCLENESIFHKFYNAFEKGDRKDALKYAKEMLELIEKTKPE